MFRWVSCGQLDLWVWSSEERLQRDLEGNLSRFFFSFFKEERVLIGKINPFKLSFKMYGYPRFGRSWDRKSSLSV